MTGRVFHSLYQIYIRFYIMNKCVCIYSHICKHVCKTMHTYSLRPHTEVSALLFVSLFDIGHGDVV